MSNRLVLFILLIGSSFVQTFAQAGQLDLTFGSNGTVFTYQASGMWAYSGALLVDGKIVVAGYEDTPGPMNYSWAMVKYESNGALDSTFAGDGIRLDNLGYVGTGMTATCVLVQPDGKFLWSGFINYYCAISRLNANGITRDSSFNFNGIKFIYDYSISSLAIQSDGKIIAVGSHFDGIENEFIVCRYQNDGTPDSSFNEDGVVFTSISGKDCFALKVLIQPDGKILVAGKSDNGMNNDFALARYKTNGELDSTFNESGILTIDVGQDYDAAGPLTLQEDGKILIAGTSIIGGYNFAIARINDVGSIDSSFGTNGTTVTDFDGRDDLIFSTAIQSDGKIVAVGISYNWQGQEFAIARYTDNGIPDSTFGVNGQIRTSYSVIGDQSATEVLIQPDDKIVVVGYSAGSIVLTRYLSGIEQGIQSPQPNNLSISIFPNPVSEAGYLDYILLHDELVSITLRDMVGRISQKFTVNEFKSKGSQKEILHFDEDLNSGLYILTVSGGSAKQSIMVSLVK